LLQRFVPRRRKQKILVHIAAAAEGRLEFLQHQKHLAVIPARFVPGLDVDD
jgi:hypothetical protein